MHPARFSRGTSVCPSQPDEPVTSTRISARSGSPDREGPANWPGAGGIRPAEDPVQAFSGTRGTEPPPFGGRLFGLGGGPPSSFERSGFSLRCAFSSGIDFELQAGLAVRLLLDRDLDDAALLQLAEQHLLGERLLDLLLDQPAERARAHALVIAALGEPGGRLLVQLEGDAAVGELRLQLQDEFLAPPGGRPPAAAR